MKPYKWYVYQVRLAGRLLYIGKGNGYRYLTSAKIRGGIAGIVGYFKREKDALKHEIDSIAEFKPPLNKTKGGEGYTRKRVPYEISEDVWLKHMSASSYKKADISPTYLNTLIAACYARAELNSRGIKGWPVEEPGKAQVDPRVDAAIRRLHDWRLLPPPASLRSTICST